MPRGVPIYSREHDPPVAGPRVLDLYVRQPGFFGVYLDEVADMNGRTNICVRAIEPGSDAHKQCPQLEPGMYVHTVNRRAVGGMHGDAVTAREQQIGGSGGSLEPPGPHS